MGCRFVVRESSEAGHVVQHEIAAGRGFSFFLTIKFWAQLVTDSQSGCCRECVVTKERSWRCVFVGKNEKLVENNQSGRVDVAVVRD